MQRGRGDFVPPKSKSADSRGDKCVNPISVCTIAELPPIGGEVCGDCVSRPFGCRMSLSSTICGTLFFVRLCFIERSYNLRAAMWLSSALGLRAC